MSGKMEIPEQVINIKEGDSIFLDSDEDRNKVNQMQLKYAAIVCRWRQAKRLSIAVHRVPGTNAWGVYLEPRKG